MDEKDTKVLCARYSVNRVGVCDGFGWCSVQELCAGLGPPTALPGVRNKTLFFFPPFFLFLHLWVFGPSEIWGFLLIARKENCCPQKIRKNMQKFGGGQTEMAIVIISGSCCIYARKVFALLGDSSEILMLFMLAQSSGKGRSYLFSQVVGGYILLYVVITLFPHSFCSWREQYFSDIAGSGCLCQHCFRLKNDTDYLSGLGPGFEKLVSSIHLFLQTLM